MAAVTPAMIKELRDRTGVSMSKCKEALETANGDIELAIANLRKAGMASAVKKEGRETKEGMIGTAQNGDAIAIVEVNAETDFVVRNDRFKQFLSDIATEAAKTHPASLEAFLQQPYSKDASLTIDQYRATIVQTIGENIQIRRLQILKKKPDTSIGVYSHMNGKIVTAVEVQGSNNQDDLAKDIAMHVAAAAPEYLNPEQVPAEIIERERDIAKGQIQGKPDFIVSKIVDGKVSAYYDANCLVRQKYIKDDSLTVNDLIERKSKELGKPLVITNFIRLVVGQ
jgi:elongation factor Ts